jgi:hypothetical protein
MWFLAWFVKQVVTYIDWVPWRRVESWPATFVAVTAVLAPCALGAGMLAYARDESTVIVHVMTKMEHAILCQAFRNGRFS